MNSENGTKIKTENQPGKRAKELYLELGQFFRPELYKDMAANGLLADHADVIRRVYTATFSSSEVIRQLQERAATDCLLFTHHPGAQHPENTPPIYFNETELQYMREHRISHYNLHLPLDQVNPYSPGVSLAKVMGLTPYESFFEEGGSVMGLICTGSFQTCGQVLRKTEALVGHSCRLYSYGEETLSDGRIALIAGGAEGTEIYETLRRAGVRLLLTGVGSKAADWFAPSHRAAEAAGVSILAAGHYSTESFALMEVCRFFRERGLAAEFLAETPLLLDL